MVLYYIKCEAEGLAKINGSILGSTKEVLCTLSPGTSASYIEWQPFSSSYLPVCACLEFENGDLRQQPLPDTVSVYIYSEKLYEITITPKKNRGISAAPHGYFDIPYKKGEKDFILRGYHDGGGIISVESMLDLRLLYLEYTDIPLGKAQAGVFENGDTVLLYVTDGEKTLLLSHKSALEETGVYSGTVKAEKDALTITEALPHFNKRYRTLTFSSGGFKTSFSPMDMSFARPENAALALVFCVKYGLIADAAMLLSSELPRETASRLPEFLGTFDRFSLPAISARCEKDTVCIALLRDVCQNIAMAKPYFFRVEDGKISNITD